MQLTESSKRRSGAVIRGRKGGWKLLWESREIPATFYFPSLLWQFLGKTGMEGGTKPKAPTGIIHTGSCMRSYSFGQNSIEPEG